MYIGYEDTLGTSHFVLCREVVLFQRRFFFMECVYKSTFLLGGLSSFRVSFIGGFTVYMNKTVLV